MSCGPGLASGWPWKQNAGRSVRARPCRLPSKSDTCVGRSVDGRVAGSTAKPWFRLGITRAVREEHAVGLRREHVARRGLRRKDGHRAAAIDEHAQDVALDAVV